MIDTEFYSIFEKIKSDLSSEHNKVRKNCLQELCINIGNESFKPISDVIAADIVKLIISSLNDKIEICREKALHILLMYLSKWDLSDKSIIFLLISTICKKLDKTNNLETSEEIRLLHIKLIKILIQKYQNEVSSFLEDVIHILTFCLYDKYPAIKQESCECAAEVAKTYPEFQNYSDEIVNAISTILKHKHYRIRVIAINSLVNIILFGRNGSIELIYSSLGECLLDHNPHVRVAVLRTVSVWFLKLRSRYSYFHYMLPLILTELAEENEEYRKEAISLWDEIGLQYLKENEENLKDKLEYLPKQLERYPDNIQRPNLGCLTLVQNEMTKIIPTVMKELEDWKIEIRIKSSELLKVIILHAETCITLCIDKMLATLFKVCTDRDPIISKNIIYSVETMGYFISPHIYWPLLVPYMSENCNRGHFIILASLLKNNSKNEIVEWISRIIAFLASDTICETQDFVSLENILEIISKLISCHEGVTLNNETRNNFYTILVSIMAFSNENLQRKVTNAIYKLSDISLLTVTDLNKTCLPLIFHRLSETCDLWESYSLNLNILIALLSTFTEALFETVPDELLIILQIVLNKNKDKEVIFKVLHAIAGLLVKENEITKNKIEFIEKIILGPLKQQLIWTAGRVAEILKATAISIVLLFLKHAEQISIDFQIEIIPLVLSSCEDSYEETRIYSLETISYFMEILNEKIEINLFSKILQVISERLNDKCDSVRLKAIKTLKNTLLYAPNLDLPIEKPNFDKIYKALQLILLNVDDSNSEIQNNTLDLFKEPSIATNVRLFFAKETLNQIIVKYNDKNASEILNKYLKI